MNGIPHAWNVTPADAIALQKLLAPQIDTKTPLDIDNIHYVAGVDVSVKNEVSRAAIVVLSFPELEVIEAKTAQMPTPFPYIPGLLTYREGEVILAARAKIQQKPDVYIFDGMGIMHPRHLGIASHMGLWLDAPTVGCGKTRFVGTYAEPDLVRGSYQPVIYKKEIVGVVLRTRDNVKPVYISVGNHATLDTAIDLILRCTTRYRLPDPIRAAHNTAGDF